jgi:hypothetical protein
MGDAKSNTGTTGFKLIQKKQVIGFFFVFVLIYGLLMVPWLGLGAGYSKFYRAGAAFLFGPFRPEGVVRFEPASDGEYDMKIVFYSQDKMSPDGKMVPIGFINHNSRHAGYIYAAFLTALILATPIPWKCKGWALFWGMILMHGFIVFNLAIWILYGFNKEPLSLVMLSPFWKRVLLLTIDVFVRNLTFGFIVCVFIWILVSFRREDWSKILARKNCLS